MKKNRKQKTKQKIYARRRRNDSNGNNDDGDDDGFAIAFGFEFHSLVCHRDDLSYPSFLFLSLLSYFNKKKSERRNIKFPREEKRV